MMQDRCSLAAQAQASCRSETRTHLRRLQREPTPGLKSPTPTAEQALPSDVLQQTRRRVGIVSLVFAVAWTLMTIINNVVLGADNRTAYPFYPYPGNVVAAGAIAASLVMAGLVRLLAQRPQRVVDLGAAYLVIQCLLVSVLSQWVPSPVVPRISWLCIPLLFYPAVVPNTPRKTLAVSLTGASMEPLVFVLLRLREDGLALDPMYMVWSFLPNYLCALMVVVPASVIYRLGRQVTRARELGSYALHESLGRGGMGEVFRGTHRMLARPAAIKVIRPEVLCTTRLGSERAKERFRREAEAVASLRSPHTVNLYDFGVSQDGTFFFVMELLEGFDLDTLVRRFGPVPPERAVYLLSQACESLAEAHAKDLVHRDIKPSNLYVCRMGLAFDFVKVLDFGLVKEIGDRTRVQDTLTAPGAAWGTPGYIAPEVVCGSHDDADSRVDIYAIGCVAYWMLTGRPVFDGTAIQSLYQHVNAVPLPPSKLVDTPIPNRLDAVVLECLAKRPQDRPDALELARRLRASVTDPCWSPARAREWWEAHLPLAGDRAHADADASQPDSTFAWMPIGHPAAWVTGLANRRG